MASGMVGWKAGAGGEVKENEIRPERPAQGSFLLGKEYGCDELRGKKRVPVSSQPNMSNGGLLGSEGPRQPALGSQHHPTLPL